MDADTFYIRIKKKGKEEILKEFFSVFIDEHEVPCYGKPNQYVIGTNNFNGTKLCISTSQ